MDESRPYSEADARVDHPPLKRGITQWLLLFFIVGDIIGAGIYALVGQVGGAVGGAIWTAFLLALILAIFTAASYAELVTKYPRAGGTATYAHNAFKMPFVSFVVAFAVAASSLFSAATLTRAFGGDYLQQFISAPTTLVALVAIVVVGLINFWGISESVRINVIFTLIEIFGLLLIVLIGIATLSTGSGEPARALEFNEGASVSIAILSGAALAFYALIGFEDSVNVAEETQNPSRVYPRVLFGGLLAAGVIYLLVTFTASMVVDTETLASSSGPLLEVVRAGPLAIPTQLFAAIALFAVANGALINMIMASRVIYGMADQEVMPSVFAWVHRGRRTPWVSIVFTTLIVMVLISTGDIGDLARATVLLLLLVFIVVNVCVFVLRRDRVEHEHFRAPSIFPILGILVSLGLLTQQQADTFLRAGALLLVGIVLWGLNYLAKRLLDKRAPR
ncbi:MAG: APC family permease [Actinomycetota bacterium]|nr:APC family permease [Actinomycetota bacterium]